MKDVRKFIPLLKSKVDPVEYGVYPLSIHTIDETTVFITRIRGEKHIVSVGPSIGLEGEAERIEDKEVIIGELNSANAAVLREVSPSQLPHVSSRKNVPSAVVTDSALRVPVIRESLLNTMPIRSWPSSPCGSSI